MSTDTAVGFSILSDIAQTFIIGVTLAIIIYFNLSNIYAKTKNNGNKYHLEAIRWAKISVVSSILKYLIKIFFMNDYIIVWDFESEKYHNFVSITDSIANTFWTIGKISFYFAFTYHVESLLINNNNYKMGNWAKFWMLFIGLSMLILVTLYTIDDAVIFRINEIGITSNNFHIVMYLGHEGAGMAIIICILFIIVDSLYFFVLLYRYVSNTKISPKEAVKGTVLILSACVIYWLFCISIVFDFDVKYLGNNIDTISDDVCLFLMFRSNEAIYDKLCGSVCNKCCTKIIYFPRYQPVSIAENDHSDNDI